MHDAWRLNSANLDALLGKAAFILTDSLFENTFYTLFIYEKSTPHSFTLLRSGSCSGCNQMLFGRFHHSGSGPHYREAPH